MIVMANARLFLIPRAFTMTDFKEVSRAFAQNKATSY